MEKYTDEKQLQSQANIISNLMMYNVKANSEKGKENEVKMEDLPKLSNVAQDVQTGYIADIHAALKIQEDP